MRDLGIIEDGAVLIENGKIAAVGTTDELARPGRATQRALSWNDEIDCRSKVVLPGFVDSHTHPVFAAPRLIDFEKRIAGASYEEIAAAGGGIRASIRGVRESSADQLAKHVLRALDEMAAHGTTTVEAKSGYGLDFESEMKSLEAIQERRPALARNRRSHAARRPRGPARISRQSRRTTSASSANEMIPAARRAEARRIRRRLLRARSLHTRAIRTDPARRHRQRS